MTPTFPASCLTPASYPVWLLSLLKKIQQWYNYMYAYMTYKYKKIYDRHSRKRTENTIGKKGRGTRKWYKLDLNMSTVWLLTFMWLWDGMGGILVFRRQRGQHWICEHRGGCQTWERENRGESFTLLQSKTICIKTICPPSTKWH